MNKPVLTQFEIYNLFNQYDVIIPIKKAVNIFIGENGMGKTTILNCIYFVLSGNIEKLINIAFDKIQVKFSDGATFTLERNDINAYVDEYLLDSKYRRRWTSFDGLFTEKEMFEIRHLQNNSNDIDEYKKFYYKISDILNIPIGIARQEFERYFVMSIQNKKNGNATNIAKFKKSISEKITEEILYFPTYRRIEEDISKLGIDIEKDKIKDKLIQFGMTDVEKTIAKMLNNIRAAAITGFTEMTGVLLRQYLDGKVHVDERYHIDTKKLSIALDRIGDKIDENYKQKIFNLLDDEKIYGTENTYLLNLIENLISSYEKQNFYDEKVKRFVSVCNSYLNGKKYIYDESKVELNIYRDNFKSPISIQNLSSGEKQVISIFSKLYLEEADHCIILFDEPELSLSIKWQMTFLPNIMKSSKCNLLVAVTHSPFIFDNEYDHLAKDMGSCMTEKKA